MTSHPTSTIASKVMKDIRYGHVSMRPKHFFWLLGLTSVFGIGLAGLSATYAWSILFFWLRIQTASGMAWGARSRLSEATATFPWWALVLSLLLLAITIKLLRGHGQLYRIRTATLVLLVTTATLFLGFLLSYVTIWQLHQGTQMPAPQHHKNQNTKHESRVWPSQ